jgi:hypothetical protein
MRKGESKPGGGERGRARAVVVHVAGSTSGAGTGGGHGGSEDVLVEVAGIGHVVAYRECVPHRSVEWAWGHVRRGGVRAG